MNLRQNLLGIIPCLALLPGCTQIDPIPRPATPTGAKNAAQESARVGVSFTKSIKPILSNQCTICHNTRVLPKRPNFETRVGAMRSGVIVPGKPEASRILAVVAENQGAEKAMPPVSHQLTGEQIALLRKWIAEGAHWPDGPAGRVKPAFIPKE